MVTNNPKDLKEPKNMTKKLLNIESYLNYLIALNNQMDTMIKNNLLTQGAQLQIQRIMKNESVQVLNDFDYAD